MKMTRVAREWEAKRHISASLQFALENRKQSMLCFDEDCFIFFAIEREQLSGHNNHEHDCGRFIDDSLERDENETMRIVA